MAEILDGPGRTANNDDGDTPVAIDESGNVIPIGGEPTGNDNGSEWTSFRGDGASGGGFADADASTGNGSDSSDRDAPFGRFANGQPRKRRAKGTRKTSSGNGKRNPAQEAIPLASLLFSTHFLASKFLVPELELSEDEAKTMGRAIADVGQYYDIPMVSPVNVAWYNLATTAAMIYGTRFVAYRNRARQEAREKRANVTPMYSAKNVGVM